MTSTRARSDTPESITDSRRLDREQASAAYCLATISDDGFVAGTEMLIFSFLRNNPWFRGRIVVLCDQSLSDASRARLARLGPVAFIRPGADLAVRVDTLAAAIPELRAAGPRFASLEAFGLGRFDRVVYIDSDAFVTGDISALFFTEHPLLACADGSHYDELLGDAAAARIANQRRYGAALSHCFNTGVLSIGAEMLDSALRDRLVADIDPATWAGVEMLGWTDQLILTRRYAGRATLVDGRYNYMPVLEAKIRRAYCLHFHDARIVHMAGRYKPWEPRPPTLFEQAPSLAKFYELWQQLDDLMPKSASSDAAASSIAFETAQMQAVMQPRTELESAP
jgi:hypothetical protein